MAVADASEKYHLSDRAAHNYVHFDHWAAIEKFLADPWSPSNPEGIINLGIAENSLMHEEVSQHIVKNMSVDPVTQLTYGNGPRGSLRLRKAAASFMNSNFRAREEIGHEDIIVMSGVSAAMDALTWSICNDGEGLLFPAPLYTGFRVDVPGRSRGVIVPVYFRDVEGYQNLDDVFDPDVNSKAFEEAYEEATANGVIIRGVVLSNPHNPLGRCYPVGTVQEVADFCGRHGLHLVVDEIYANSGFENPLAPEAIPFTSVRAMDLGGRIDPSLVHVVYGASKDFCANGLRIGILQSKNPGLLGAVATISPFSWPSYVMQDIWASMLENDEFLRDFFAKNRRLLADNFALATAFLDKHNIKYYSGSNYGVFIWVDLRHYLLPTSANGSLELANLRLSSPDIALRKNREAQIVAKCLENGVGVGYGSNFFTEELGWYRITFTVAREALLAGLGRLVTALRDLGPP